MRALFEVTRSQVAGGCGAELFAEGGDEGAGTVVTRIEGGSGYFFAGGEELHGVQEAELLAPAAEGHTGLFDEEALDGAFAGATGLAKGGERAAVGRI